MKECFLSFAGVPRESFFGFSRSRESREGEIPIFGVCGSPASVIFFSGLLAGVPRERRSPFSLSRAAREHRLRTIGVRPRLCAIFSAKASNCY